METHNMKFQHRLGFLIRCFNGCLLHIQFSSHFLKFYYCWAHRQHVFAEKHEILQATWQSASNQNIDQQVVGAAVLLQPQQGARNLQEPLPTSQRIHKFLQQPLVSHQKWRATFEKTSILLDCGIHRREEITQKDLLQRGRPIIVPH